MIKATQQRMAQALGLQKYLDEGCYDPSRACFLSTQNDVLYFDETNFTSPEIHIAIENKKQSLIKTCMQKKQKETMNVPAQVAGENTLYEGVSVKEIEREFYSMNGGEPTQGNRHNSIMDWAKVAVYMADTKEQLKSMLTPYGLPENELERISKWVYEETDMLTYPSSIILESIVKKLKGVNTPLTPQEITQRLYTPAPMPEVPEIVNIFTKRYDDEGWKIVIFLSCLTTLGVTHNYINSVFPLSAFGNKTEYPDFITFIFGVPGSGKSAISNVSEALRQAQENYDIEVEKQFLKKKKNRIFNNPPKRILDVNTTKAALLEQFAQNNGRALLLKGEEVKSASDSYKNGNHADLTTMLRLAFDRAKDGQMRQGKDYLSVSANVCLSLLLTGTPADTFNFVKSQLNDGGARRFIFAPIPKREDEFSFLQPSKPLDEAEKVYIEKISNEALKNTYNENGTIKAPQYIDMTWLSTSIDEWLKSKQTVAKEKLAMVDKEKANYFFSLVVTTAEISFRMSMLMYHLWGEKEEAKTKVVKLFHWFADWLIYTKFALTAEYVDDQSDFGPKENKQKKTPKSFKYKQEYDELGDEFSRAELQIQLDKYRNNVKARQVISCWKRLGYINVITNDGTETIVKTTPN